MRSFLLSCIPVILFIIGVQYLIYSYTHEWPEFWWSLAGWVCLGAAYGARRLLD